jgi:hypothetical protein
MTSEPVTAVEAWRLRRNWKVNLLALLAAILLVFFLATLVVGIIVLRRISDNSTPHYADIVEHFKYGSIGAEPSSGIPYAIWKVLPALYPDEFEGRDDYSAFGFLYEDDEAGRQRDLPVGISQRKVRGVEVVWLNCATCHTGTWRADAGDAAAIVPAMPSNNLDFGRFVRMVFRLSTDPRLAPDRLFEVMEEQGIELDALDRLIWRIGVLPIFREGLLQTRASLLPLMDMQPSWGPGRVDTFNPYKLLQFGVEASALTPEERIGVADLPAVFDQRPREGMNLHWDGNNASLAERNLSAAIGAGVTVESVDHEPRATGIRMANHMCSTDRVLARSSRSPNWVRTGRDSIPTRRRSGRSSSKNCLPTRPTSSKTSGRRMATPTCLWTGCGCADPICTTGRCRRWQHC